MPSSIQRIQLASQSYEWSQVDYQLQVATGKSSLKLLTVHKYDDKNAAQSLDYKSTHTAMINVTDFSKEYSDKLIEKTLSLEDVVFKCGHINIQKFIANQHKIITFLICKVYLGKIGHNNDPDVTQCDSIFIEPQTTQDVFQFNYFLRSAAQYSIQYEVTFTTSQQKQFKLQQFQCSACQNRIPTLYCKTQNLFFCQNCCNQHHKSKLMATHQLQPINKVNTLGHCKNHNQKLQYYCMKCVKYLCGQCVQKGVHHQNSQHPFEKVDILYEEKRQTVEDVAKRPKEKLGTLMVNLGLKRKQIDQNYALVKQSITKKYQNALQVLNQIYYEKCQTLSSCQTEIKMLTQKIQWSKAFIIFEEKNLKPLHYFESQKKFEQDLSKLKIAEFEGIFTTKPDIKLEGDFVVGTQDNIDHYRKKLLQQGQTNSQNTSYEKGLSGIYKYKPTGEKPKIGDLTLMLQNTKLNFFQVVASR